jgi:hypothetical protein
MLKYLRDLKLGTAWYGRAIELLYVVALSVAVVITIFIWYSPGNIPPCVVMPWE